MRKILFIITAILLLSACGIGEQKNVEKEVYPSEVTVEENDFIYHLYTEKDVYDEFGGLAIFAELTYVGEEDSIDIYHAASPFSFPIEEKTRGFEVDYAMNLPLIITTLKKDEPFRKKYGFAGGFDDTDDKAYIVFVESLMEGKFPEGYYIIRGSVDFSLEDPSVVKDEQNVSLTGNIGFTVK